MTSQILIGFEKGSAKPVFMEAGHTNISGLTQKSGKTTTIKALISRSNARAIVFLTKRGEIPFAGYNTLEPFYKAPKEGITWQYATAVLEAHLGERVKYERRWIMNSVKGAKTLRDVYENIQRLRKSSKHYFDEGEYFLLEEYFKDVLPQMENRTWATSLPLGNGINVMDLVDLTQNMQNLVIQSTLDYIMDRMRGIIAVVPEAWKFVPKSKTPVKLAAESFIRQGASLRNYLFIDSQDLAGVDTMILKQCYNWLMGFQRELNEAERVAKTAGKKVNYTMIQQLKLGHFVAVIGTNPPKVVYVWPDGVPKEMALRVARGEVEPEAVRDYLEKMKVKSSEEDEELYKELYEQTLKEKELMEKELEDLRSQKVETTIDPALIEKVQNLEKDLRDLQDLKRLYDELKETNAQLEADRDKQLTAKDREIKELGDELAEKDKKLASIDSGVRVALKGLIQEVIEDMNIPISEGTSNTGVQVADVELEISKPELTLVETRHKVSLTEESQEGRILMLWVRGELKKDEVFSMSALKGLYEKYGWTDYHNRWTREALTKLVLYRFIDTKKAGRRTDYFFTMTPEEAVNAEKMELEIEPKLVTV